MNFPTSPALNDTYSLGSKTWKWNGVAWDLQSTGLTSAMVVSALGYTPYNATNPSGYITSSALSPYLTSATAASTYQPVDADLTAIAALTGSSGFLKTNGSGTWSVDTATYLTTATAASTYQTQSGMSSYLTTATASSTYLPLAGGTLTGNLAFSGTGLRITGDFSNATMLSRTLFQSSTANGNTQVGAIPNGTAVNSAFFTYNNSDPTNASTGILRINGSEVALISGITGTGTYLPLVFLTNNLERGRFDTAGNWGVGTSTPKVRAQFSAGSAQNAPTLGTAQGIAYFTNSDAAYGLLIGNSSATGAAWFQAQRTDTTATAYDLLLNPAGGNVGIGTSSPAAKLDTAGTIRSTTQTVPASGTGAELYYDATNAGLRGYNRTGSAYVNLALNDNVYIGGGSAGNLGFGVTPSAWGASAGKAFDISTYSAVYQNLGNNATGIGNNVYINSSPAFVYKNTAAASTYQQTNGIHYWYSAGSGTAGTTIGFTNTMTLDVSGNLTAAANITAYSDERLKKDWSDLPSDFIERLAQVKHGTYTRIDNGQRQAGVGAQSLRPLLPEVILEGEHLAVAYGNAAMVSAVELAKRVVRLEKLVASLGAK